MEYISEEQQVEQIKKWWAENGSSIIIGLVLGIGGIMGWRFWSDHQIDQSAQASTHFETMMFALENNQYEKAGESAQAIISDYSSTPYLIFSQFSLAKIQFEQGNLDQAEATLNNIIEVNTGDSYEFLARKRLADVLLDQKKLDQALTVISVEYPSSFQAAFEERKGDIYRKQGDKAKAKSAYLLAKVSNHPAENSQFLQQKMDNLGQ